MKEASKPLTPGQQLVNVYDSLADDVFDAPSKVGRGTANRASAITRDAINEALQRRLPSDGNAQQEWIERTEKDGLPFKGPVK